VDDALGDRPVIDSQSEELLTLAQAAKLLPRRRAGKKTSVTTLYRWTNKGCRGVRLEYLQCGASRCTSREALDRFFQALTVASQTDATAEPVPTMKARRKAYEAAERELTLLGV
jgi:hypothetical protein